MCVCVCVSVYILFLIEQLRFGLSIFEMPQFIVVSGGLYKCFLVQRCVYAIEFIHQITKLIEIDSTAYTLCVHECSACECGCIEIQTFNTHIYTHSHTHMYTLTKHRKTKRMMSEHICV